MEILSDLDIDPYSNIDSGLKTSSKFTPSLASDNVIDIFYKGVTSDLYSKPLRVSGVHSAFRRLGHSSILQSRVTVAGWLSVRLLAALAGWPKGAPGATIGRNRKR
ncbi:hypothetical protein NDU88_002393 [Pleurodeles waltl]|uniref:Uncharacterized protein n=1 Tax=Pleurodeles waltl TaxID=8319 RepID=A0AAV7T263_PLEWA|nr:hypothetical protein NDU88_002393 [Pleurodeles waltl]